MPYEGDKNARYDPLKFTWLGSTSSYADDAYLLLVNRDHPAQTVDDLKKPGIVARLGGDEFVLLLPETPAADSMSTLLRLQRSLAQRPLPLDGQRVPVHFSAGLAQWQPGEAADALLRRADAALYAAKRVGKNRVQAAEPPAG